MCFISVILYLTNWLTSSYWCERSTDRSCIYFIKESFCSVSSSRQTTHLQLVAIFSVFFGVLLQLSSIIEGKLDRF